MASMNVDWSYIGSQIAYFFKNLPPIFNDSPTDQQVAYIAVGLGLLLILVGLVLKIIL